MTKTWFLFTTLLLVVFPVAGAVEAADLLLPEQTAAVLDLPSDARSAGIAGADLSTSPQASLWVSAHPAFAAWQPALAVSSSVYLGFAGITAASAGVAAPGFQATFLQLDSGIIQGEDEPFRFLVQAARLDVAMHIDTFSIGVRAKGYAARQPSFGLGAALDVGVALRTPSFAFAGLVENALSLPITYAGGHVERWSPRVCLLSAISIPLTSGVSWGTSGKIVLDADGFSAVAAGTEAWLGPVGLRAGYDGEAVSMGLSLQFPGYGFHIAYTMHADLGATYMASLDVLFDGLAE